MEKKLFVFRVYKYMAIDELFFLENAFENGLA